MNLKLHKHKQKHKNTKQTVLQITFVWQQRGTKTVAADNICHDDALQQHLLTTLKENKKKMKDYYKRFSNGTVEQLGRN